MPLQYGVELGVVGEGQQCAADLVPSVSRCCRRDVMRAVTSAMAVALGSSSCLPGPAVSRDMWAKRGAVHRESSVNFFKKSAYVSRHQWATFFQPMAVGFGSCDHRCCLLLPSISVRLMFVLVVPATKARVAQDIGQIPKLAGHLCPGLCLCGVATHDVHKCEGGARVEGTGVGLRRIRMYAVERHGEFAKSQQAMNKSHQA